MRQRLILFNVVCLSLLLSCEVNEVFLEETYHCNNTFQDSSGTHPKAAIYQSILDENRKLGIVGASLMIKDKDGVWLGSSGKADIASNIAIKTCNRFLIASISKSFTATVVFKFIENGILSLDDKISIWLSDKVIGKIENARSATVRNLLNHTSGIADYQTIQFELDRINKEYNNWKQEDILRYIYGKKATHPVGETYYYSNTNYLLLGMILEQASGRSLEELYQNEIFSPLNLHSGYFDTDLPIPSDLVKGYVDMYGNGQFVESEFLYKDELNTADGGIAMNAYDLGLFFEQLMTGKVLSEESLQAMTAWFDLPPDWIDKDYGHFQNGLGLEYNQTKGRRSVGHTGGIDGFLSIAHYFPEEEATFVLLVNSGSYKDQPRLNIYEQCLAQMFD